MGTTLLNEYRLDFADNHSEPFVAQNMRSAVLARDTDTLPLTQITRIKTGIGVETPIRNVKFVVTSLPESAAQGGCHAAPDTWIVPEGTKVIFTAMPGAGFDFDGWYLKDGTTALATDVKAELQIDYPADPADVAFELEARFVPVP